MGMPEPEAIMQAIGGGQRTLRELALLLGVHPRRYRDLSDQLLNLKLAKRVEISATTGRYQLGHNALGVQTPPVETTPTQRRTNWNRDGGRTDRAELLAQLHATRGRTTEAIALAVGSNTPTIGRLLSGMRRDGVIEKHGSHWVLADTTAARPSDDDAGTDPAPKAAAADPASLATEKRDVRNSTELPESMRAVLDAIEDGGSTVSEIAVAVGSTVTATGQRIARLRARGLVERDGQKTDRHARWRRVITGALTADADTVNDSDEPTDTGALPAHDLPDPDPAPTITTTTDASPPAPCNVRGLMTLPSPPAHEPIVTERVRYPVALPPIERCMRLGTEHLIALLRTAGVEIPAHAVIDVDDAGTDPLISVRWSA